MEASRPVSSGEIAMTFDERMAIKSRLQRRLEIITSTYRDLEIQYRKLGLIWHSLPLADRRPHPDTPHMTRNTAFDISKPQAHRILQFFLHYRECVSSAKKHLLKLALTEAGDRIQVLEDDATNLQGVMRFLQSQTPSEQPLELPTSPWKRPHEYRMFAAWLIIVPEISDAIEKKWGAREDDETAEVLTMAMEALNEIEGLDLDVEEMFFAGAPISSDPESIEQLRRLLGLDY